MQCSLRTLFFIYLFGGLTFIPLVIISVLAFIYYTSPVKTAHTAEEKILNEPEPAARPPITPGEELKDDDELEGVDAHKVGWLQVSREYDSSIGLIGPEKIPGNHRGKYMDKMRSLLDRQDTLGPNNTGFLKVKAAMFYAVLKHGNLFLYETEEQLDVKHVIVLQHFVTTMWPPYEDDDELFLKPNAICLSRKETENGSIKSKSDNESTASDEKDVKPHKRRPPQHSYFLFPTTNIAKEDWYFALLRGSKTNNTSQKPANPTDPTIAAVPAHFDPDHMFSLIQAIHSSDAQLQTRWLNALIGRIFLASYQTKHLEEICIKKITKKIARVNRPAFLSDIRVQRVHVGSQAPIFTQPRLKELSAAGEFAADVNLSYNGGFRIEIATIATLQLGSRFKPRQVSISMAVTIKKLEGKLLLRIKKSPSNRIWVGFYEPPTIEMSIEPIVSSRQITYTMVLRAIESRIREAIEESVVLPNMDDTAFIPTTGEFYRGGIWQRKDEEEKHPLDPALSGDVEGVEKEMEATAKGDSTPKEESPENSESADSVDQLEPRRRVKTTLRSPSKESTTPKVASEQNLRSRLGRSASFTSVSSAPAVVATDPVNVSGTSPSRDTVDWAAEAAARAIAHKARISDSPKLNADIPGDIVEPGPSLSDRLSSSADDPQLETVEKTSGELTEESVHMTLENQSEPVLPTTDREVGTSPLRPASQASKPISPSPEKEALFSTRVSQATGAAKDMLKSRLNTYLAKRQQSKLQKQILTNDRDLLVNSIKPRTRLPSETSPKLDPKSEDDDLDSGPLPFENKKSPLFAPSEFTALSSPVYGPSAMMTIPSTMANSRPSMPDRTTSASSPPPPLPARSPSTKKPLQPPLPARSAPRAIPRRPVPPIPQPSHDPASSAPTTASSPESTRDRSDSHVDDDDLLILHIDEDEDREQPSRASSVKDAELGSSPERKRVEREEEAVLEPSSYGSNRSRRPSMSKDPSMTNQWNEKQVSDREMPEMIAEGLMG